MTQFSDLGLAEPVLRALKHEGYDVPTPIQAQAIPSLLEGKDLLGIAQTGTGKTAAFALPILDRLFKSNSRTPAKSCRVLVLAPTRELAAQIGDSFRAYGRFMNTTVAVVVGGVSHGPQIKAITPGVDVLVATPGRLLDHIDAGKLKLSNVEVIVLDEADHMLDLGFLPPIKRVIKMLPRSRQNLFFSATMPSQIGQLAGDMLSNPVKVSVTPVASTQELVEQSVYMIEKSRKRQLLAELLDDPLFKRTLVFTRTKRGADRVARHLESCKISAAAIHGNKSQNQRERALNAFKDGQIGVLVATDIAARGIDVDSVSHVVNFELPNVPESYVHRIGRTARGGASGSAIAFCDEEERGLLRDIEKTTRQSIRVIDRRDAKAAAEQDAISRAERAANPERRGDGGGRNAGRLGQRNGNSNGNRNGQSRNAGGRGDGARNGERSAQGRNDRNDRNPDRRNGEASRDAVAGGAENGGRYKGGIKAGADRGAERSDRNDRAAARPPRSEDGRRDGRDNRDARDTRNANGDGRVRSAKKVSSNGAGGGDNRIASNLSFLGTSDERRTSGNGANTNGKPANTGKPGGRNTRPNNARPGKVAGGRPGGRPNGESRTENNSGNRSRRELA
ncbi:DEAD/DEAH box helicase [Thalassospira alkalitolerans]|uniref:DEAD-box ATP-dependent RNA helicase RhpA n=1 Tax=Thalassospira alkalitolerans TaxID=1293890 RepID=A0A1Y2LA31_9PROT|nr:DEAD/DEAH box helicase [Thalassospira alkalitolerans]OSQ47396.1 DEAD/DEAH box helicase [Thalassospira alkalitolerans]